MAQSTNDLIPTAIALAALRLLPDLDTSLDTLATSLETKAAAWDHIVKSGRTHLQDATPIRLGQEFGGYAAAIRRNKAAIQTAAIPVGELSIGGTAVGTGLNAEPSYRTHIIDVLTDLTGFQLQAPEDYFYSMQSMARFSQLSSALRTLAIDLNLSLIHI